MVETPSMTQCIQYEKKPKWNHSRKRDDRIGH
jgi:hypothetical protein